MQAGASYRECLETSDYEEAKRLFANKRAAILNGTYAKPATKVTPAPVVDRPTFAVVAGRYADNHIRARLAPGAADNHKSYLEFLAGVTVPPGVPFTDKPFHLITLDDYEMAITAKRMPTTKTYRKGEKTWTRTVGGVIAANRFRDYLCHLSGWALRKGYTDSTPFNVAGQVPDELKKPKNSEHARDRRLDGDEEKRLLDAAGEHLNDCIIAALEAGMRKGELLSLQWRHVRWMQNELALEWGNTKTKRSRQIPISPTLREVLARRQKAHLKTLSDAERLADLYVFGDEIGGRIKNVKTAWETAVLRAYGVKIERKRGKLSAGNRARLAEIDLNFHDLRHEAGSRKLEAGWPLHAVSRWLGHTKLTTTDTYLNATTQLLHELNERVPLALVKR